VSGDEVRTWFTYDDIDILLLERAGEVAGYADRTRRQEDDRDFFDVRVRGGDSAGAELLLRELEARVPSGGSATWAYVASVDETLRDAVSAAGFELVRHSFQMTRPLDGVEPPEWPDGIRVATFEPEQVAAVHAAAQESFADHWEHRDSPLEEWRKHFLEDPRFDPSLWFVAWDRDEVAGVSLCRLHPSGDAEHGYVSTLGVRRPWRRQGLGTALLLHSFADMKRRGMTKASLGVDAENTTGAVRLYERAGMTVDQRYDLYRKPL
jgi:mycothiol synthase